MDEIAGQEFQDGKGGPMSRVLVVDDKSLMRDSVSTMLARAGWKVQAAASGDDALQFIADKKPDAVLTDLQMPGMTGVELLRAIRQFDEQLPVIFMTAFATVQTAVEAMKLGAYDYLTKPFNGDQLVATVRRALDHGRLLRENAILQSQVTANSVTHPGNTAVASKKIKTEFVGRSRIMRALKADISQIATSQSTVLISGESGVGKEVVARAIHELSTRSSEALLAVNCAALSASLLESELFGHERGAFTGADRLRKGRFELADNGTLLLDEISEVPVPIQAKLLRVLQERTFERVGSSISQRTDVRVIATTNRDLPREIHAGRFRQDLFYRLNVLPITIPPLRRHVEDIPDLANYFLRQTAKREGKQPKQFDDEAIRLMQSYRWPGNIRELGNICERACLFSAGEDISASIIQPWLTASFGTARRLNTPPPPHASSASPAPTAPPTAGNSVVEVRLPGAANYGSNPDLAWEINGVSEQAVVGMNDFSETEFDRHDPMHDSAMIALLPGRSLEDIERQVIVMTLKRNDGHRQRTAKDLGIAVRTLGLKLRKWKELQLVEEDL